MIKTLFGDTLTKVSYTSVDVPFTFQSTGRATLVRYSKPEGAGPFRLVIVSHGLATELNGHALECYEQAVAALCSSGLGFACLRPLYRDAFVEPDDDAWRSDRYELNELVNRALEIGAFHEDACGAMGHSRGTDRTMGCRGCQYTVNPAEATMNNPAIAAMALWSPVVDETREIVPDSFAHLAAPILTVTGLKDDVRQGVNYRHRLQVHESAPRSIERIKFVHKYGHAHAGAVGTPTPPAQTDAATAAAACDVTLAFFAAKLLGHEGAQKWLEEGATRWKTQLASASGSYEYLRARQ